MSKFPARLVEVGVDVVIRFKGFNTYGTWEKAVKALRRRAPGFTDTEYELLFLKLSDLFDRAVELIFSRSERVFPKRENKNRQYAEFEDVDYQYCLERLRASKSHISQSANQQILSWVIHYYYLIQSRGHMNSASSRSELTVNN